MTEQVVIAPRAPQPALLHDAAWAAATMEAGPNGMRFDGVDRLLGAAALPAGVEAMYDSTSVAAEPVGAFAYAGYYNGTYANMKQLALAFPNAVLVSVTPDGAKGAMYIDIEPGNVGPESVPAFIKAGGLGFYASPGATGYTVQECIDACTAAGIPRTAYRIWSAHWIGRHICGPGTCGYPQADGTQYVSTAGWDESAVTSPVFFQPPAAPAPVPQAWTGDGSTSLAGAAALGGSSQTPAVVLYGTMGKYGLTAALGTFLDDLLTGKLAVSAPVPASVTLWLSAPPAPPSPPPAPSPSPSPLPAWQAALYAKLPAVRLGSVDQGGTVPWVRQVQLLINALGTPVTVDGNFGPATQAAVESVQRQGGLLTTGWADPVTWEILLAFSVTAALPTLGSGNTGTAVKVVQALCEAHGLQLSMDGNFGPATQAAVIAVQKAYYPNDAAQQDGVVGPATWSLLAAHSLP